MANNPFIVYKASAGSGKTYALVKEYLKMIFRGDEEHVASRFRSVLAITFTNKAANEMKERIMDELRAMAAAPVEADGRGMGADLLRELCAEAEAAGRKPWLDGATLSRMAAHLYTTVLHAYSDFSVSTIDSFTHRLVRTFAHDFGQPPNFAVEVEEKELLMQTVAGLLSLTGTDGQDGLSRLLAAFADSRMDEGNSFKLEYQLRQLAKQLLAENAYVHLEMLDGISATDAVKLYGRALKREQALRATMAQTALQMVQALRAGGIDEGTAMRGRQGFFGYLLKVSEGYDAEPTPAVRRVVAEGQLVKASSSHALLAASDQLAATVQQGFATLEEQIVDRQTCALVRKHLYATALLGALNEQKHLYERDNEMVHLSAFNRMVNRVVEDEENPAPFIYERLGSRYRHFLVDEFQDTSIMQWHNLVPLLENGVSQGHGSLVVGDGKQSIYRFRQGDVDQFVALPQVKGMRHHGRVLSMPGNSRVESLEVNYRSARSIVDFNNELFSHLARTVFADNALAVSIYIGRDADGQLNAEGHEELRQRAASADEGYVAMVPVSKAMRDAENFDDIKDAIDQRVVDTIRRLVDEQGYDYRDFLVLARTKNRLARLSKYMSAHSDIPQTSAESFLLVESHAVMAIMAVLRLMCDRGDRLAAAELRYRLMCLGLLSETECEAAHDALADQAWQRGSQDRRVRVETHEVQLPVEIDFARLAGMDLYDCCEEVVRELHLDGLDVAYVASLLNRAAAFSAQHKQNVGEFIDWFDQEDGLSVAAPGEVDAVQLLTVHKAKGLGWPVVICVLEAMADRGASLWVDLDGADNEAIFGPSETAQEKPLPTLYARLGKSQHTRFDRYYQQERLMQEVDELNVLYVAFTRPLEQLYAFYPDYADTQKKSEENRSFPALLYSFAPEGCTMGDEGWTRRRGRHSGEGKHQEEVGTLSFPDWTARISIASPSERALDRVREEKVRFGIYAHNLLAGVEHAADVDEAVARFAAAQEVQAEERDRLAELVQRVVTHPVARRFFDGRWRVSNECELVVDGKRMRPDRVVFADAATWVIDFKTGSPLAEHEPQVAAYCQALGAMGYPGVRGYLLYVQSDVVLEQCYGEPEL